MLRLLLAVLVLLILPATASAHGQRALLVGSPGPAGCPGDPIAPTQVITGQFTTAEQGSFVMLPFTVPPGTTQVRVKYCFDQPEAALPMARHTLDLGLWDARRDVDASWEEAQFRGWGGSSHPDVIVSPQGFGPEEAYRERPRGNVPGRTTRGFRPGPIAVGQWAVELGVAAVVPQSLGDADGRVGWRVEIELSQAPAFAAEPYRPAPYDSTPARPGAGWYAGDMHVHGEHSALQDATMTETFDFAFGALDRGGAGLDFVTLSDYVAGSSWGEIGRYQPRHPGRLIVRSSEVITYRGHANNHASGRFIDHRTGPVLERMPDGTLRQQRAAAPASRMFDQIRAGGGFTQINHPTIFPSSVPTFELFCRGCPWDYTPAETDYRKVDAIEVATGPAGLKVPGEPGPNPFTPLAIDFYERALATGARIAAVGVSDSHNAGRTNDPVTQAPIGQATTVVYADELSEAGLRRAVKRRHTYAKLFGNDGPDLRLEARAPGQDGPPAIMGDVLRAGRAQLTAQVLNADPSRGYQLQVVRDGVVVDATQVTAGTFTRRFSAMTPGRYRLQLMRGTAIEGVTSPVFLDPSGAPDADDGDAAALVNRVSSTGTRLRVRRGRFAATTRCRAQGFMLRTCTVRLRARVRRSRGPAVTLARASAPLRGGEARMRLRLTRAGRALLGRRRSARVTIEATATGSRGTVGPDRRRVRMLRGR